MSGRADHQSRALAHLLLPGWMQGGDHQSQAAVLEGHAAVEAQGAHVGSKVEVVGPGLLKVRPGVPMALGWLGQALVRQLLPGRMQGAACQRRTLVYQLQRGWMQGGDDESRPLAHQMLPGEAEPGPGHLKVGP